MWSPKRKERNNPLPIPKFRVGDFLVLHTHDWGSDRILVKVLRHKNLSGDRIGKVIWRMGKFAEHYDYDEAHLGPDCDWTIEVVGRGDE